MYKIEEANGAASVKLYNKEIKSFTGPTARIQARQYITSHNWSREIQQAS